jgi:hypothetical protein
MQFRKTTTISIGDKTKPIFEKLEKMRPDHMSFSLFLAVVIEDYLQKNTKITNAKYPRVMDRIEAWSECISSLTNEELITITGRIQQLSNKVQKEVGRRL